jgi:adenylate kinase
VALNLIMLGAPGAGKGTQAIRLARARGIPQISTGEILREAVAAGTEIGRRAKALMDRGELVSDEVILGIVEERLNRADVRDGFILDGFPRTVGQATALDALMAGRDPLVIVDIAVPEEELVRRLASRRICKNCGLDAAVLDGSEGTVKQTASAADVCRRCGGTIVQRADDNESVVRERLRVYQRNTAPLVEYYRGRPTFRSIDGLQTADRVAATIAAAVDGAGAAAMSPGAGR